MSKEKKSRRTDTHLYLLQDSVIDGILDGGFERVRGQIDIHLVRRGHGGRLHGLDPDGHMLCRLFAAAAKDKCPVSGVSRRAAYLVR